jgi:D-arabinose 1-dehydrogenase-like Zn-dependent alcohol dehydrogenase
MTKMNAIQVGRPGNELELVQRDIPQPGPGQVRIKVAACGICHSDVLVKEGHWPGVQYPRSPGHEVAGIVDEIGSAVTAWKKGQRVGVGWAGGYCGLCEPCRRGDPVNCLQLRITGFSFDGGYAEYMIAPKEALAEIPAELSLEEAAPLLCAGLTTFNALRHSDARPGDLVAIQGIGGLGHLGIQFAKKMGFKTVAISKGADKAVLAEKLGAHVYIDTEKSDPAVELAKMGGARLILGTAPSGKSLSTLINGLGHQGELIVVGAGADPIEVTAVQLITMKHRIKGWASGSAIDSEDTMKFCVLTGVRPMIEVFPLDQAGEALKKVLSNKVRFRAVLKTGREL